MSPSDRDAAAFEPVASTTSPLRSLLPARLRHLLGGRSTLVRGSMWGLIGTGSSGAASLVSALAVSAIVGVERFGGFSLVVTATLAILAIVGLNMRPMVTKSVATDLAEDPSSAGDHLVTSVGAVGIASLIGIAIVLAGAPWYCRSIVHHPAYATLFRWNCALILTSPITTALFGALAGFQRFRGLGMLTAFRGIIDGAGIVVGALVNGVLGAVIGGAITEVVVCAVTIDAVRRAARSLTIPLRFRLHGHALVQIRRLLGPFYLTNITIMTGMWLGSTFLSQQHHGLYELGLFALASRFYSVAILPTTVISTVAFPLLAASFGRRDTTEYIATARRYFVGTLSIVVVLCAGIAAIGGVIATFSHHLPGRFFADLAILGGTAIPGATNSVVGVLLVTTERYRWWWISDVLLGVALPAIAWATVPHLGSVGLAISYFAAYALSTLAMAPGATRQEMAVLLFQRTRKEP